MTSKAERDRLFFLRKGWGRDGWCSPPVIYMTNAVDKQIARLLKDGLIEPDEYGGGQYRITERGKESLKNHFGDCT